MKNSKELIDEITKLTDEWYRLIGPDHHKNRDCHWHINTTWSYGNSPVYVIEHFGYIIDEEIIKSCLTYDDALKTLKIILEKEIEEYRNYRNQDNDY